MSRGRGNFGGERGDDPRRTAAAARWWYWTLREVYDCGDGRTGKNLKSDPFGLLLPGWA